MIFTTKSLIYTAATGAIGILFYYLFAKLLGMTLLGIGITIIFAAIGFVIGTFKIPDNNGMELTRKLGGEEIDKAFVRWWKFRKRGNIIYTYLKEDNVNNK